MLGSPALNFSGTDFVLDPMEHITNLFMAGKIEQLQTDAARMINDPKYRFFDFEGRFNKAGHQLLNGGQIENAIFVFHMVTESFPDSANAWDSLAEAYLKAGDTAKATELYNKAINMDPDGPTGKNAKEMLRQMTAGEHN